MANWKVSDNADNHVHPGVEFFRTSDLELLRMEKLHPLLVEFQEAIDQLLAAVKPHPEDATLSCLNTSYYQHTDNERKKYGRYHAKGPSTQTLPLPIRELLCGDLYLQVEMVDCHLSILAWLLAKFPLSSSTKGINAQTFFHQYFAKPEQCLQLIAAENSISLTIRLKVKVK